MADFDQFSDVFDENEDSISRRVFADADEDIDRRPGEMFHDITIPVVQEMARLWSAVNTVAAVTFIPWSSGVYLDYKGSYEIGLDRREGTASDGELTFVGDLATDIPANTIVRTLAYNAGDPVYEFRTTVNEKIGMELPADTEPS
ncbi:MAG: baseplate J/gp47 family protein, partial [Opitutae bacterium]